MYAFYASYVDPHSMIKNLRRGTQNRLHPSIWTGHRSMTFYVNPCACLSFVCFEYTYNERIHHMLMYYMCFISAWEIFWHGFSIAYIDLFFVSDHFIKSL